MKAELVENLILAHCSGEEKKFADAVNRLAGDELKKGNVAIASRIRRAYESHMKASHASGKISDAAEMFSASSIEAAQLPRDKDSLLELYEIRRPDISLSDVVLPESQRRIIEQIISEQRNAEEFIRHGVVPVNRVLFCGPPGCGKTMTAFAIGHELSLPVAYVRLDGLVSSYLGQTSTNLRKVFDSVRNRKIVLFLDEFDAIAKKRDDANELGELKRVVTSLLQNFDSLPSNVLLIAATNHEHLLDPAVWRRFNLTVTLGYPDIEQRKRLIGKETEHYGIRGKISTDTVARITEGLSCSRISELMMAAEKRMLLSGTIKTQDISEMLVQQQARYSGIGDDSVKAVSELIGRGVSLRSAAGALGISASTLEYRIKKYRSRHDEEI
jgi:SpoVK/Ycf46/Vps4 family AAA+-type ATPase